MSEVLRPNPTRIGIEDAAAALIGRRIRIEAARLIDATVDPNTPPPFLEGLGIGTHAPGPEPVYEEESTPSDGCVAPTNVGGSPGSTVGDFPFVASSDSSRSLDPPRPAKERTLPPPIEPLAPRAATMDSSQDGPHLRPAPQVSVPVPAGFEKSPPATRPIDDATDFPTIEGRHERSVPETEPRPPRLVDLHVPFDHPVVVGNQRGAPGDERVDTDRRGRPTLDWSSAPPGPTIPMERGYPSQWERRGPDPARGGEAGPIDGGSNAPTARAVERPSFHEDRIDRRLDAIAGMLSELLKGPKTYLAGPRKR